MYRFALVNCLGEVLLLILGTLCAARLFFAL